MLWKDINEKLLKYTDKYVNTCTYNWACRYIELIKKVYDSSFRDEYFEIILNELLKDRESHGSAHKTDIMYYSSLQILSFDKKVCRSFFILIERCTKWRMIKSVLLFRCIMLYNFLKKLLIRL